MNLAKSMLAASALALAWAIPAAAQDETVVLAANTTGSPDERAAAMLAQMTPDEKLVLVKGYFGADFGGLPGSDAEPYQAPPEAREGSAGYVPGIPRLGIPPQWETDAGIGVATQGSAEVKRARTALPSGLATAATWDPALAYAGGAMIGAEARADGFNVMLAGGVNLLREPRNGRNFEYAGEDPLLAGSIVGASIAGIQSNAIISTAKHYALNDQETDRMAGNFVIDQASLRMSDLLAFEFAIERGRPGSVMCAYNLVNGIHACEHPWLLTQVLRGEWGWPGYVMSDWGGVHSTVPSARAGLDQESGYGLQQDDWFGADKLQAALGTGAIDSGMIDTMAARILRTMFALGVIDDPVSPDNPIPFEAHRAVSQAGAEGGIVLLKNEAIFCRSPASRASLSSAAMPTPACFRAAGRARSIPMAETRFRELSRSPGLARSSTTPPPRSGNCRTGCLKCPSPMPRATMPPKPPSLPPSPTWRSSSAPNGRVKVATCRWRLARDKTVLSRPWPQLTRTPSWCSRPAGRYSCPGPAK